MRFTPFLRLIYRRYPLIISTTLLSALLMVSTVIAQTNVCPPQTLLSIARAGAACAQTEAGEVCFGSGSGSYTLRNGETTETPQSGDRISLREVFQIEVLEVQTTDDVSVSVATLAIRTSPNASDVVTVLLFGEARLQDEGILSAQFEIAGTAIGSLPVRATPESDGELIVQLAVNSGVTLNGRTEEGDWLRVVVPETGAVGWASAALLNTGDINNLPIVAPGDPVTQPFQTIHFQNGDRTACDGALPAGALLQTPSTEREDAVELTLNGLSLRLAGTLFLREEADTLTLTVLDGVAEIEREGEVRLIPAGAQITVMLDGDGNGIALLSNAAPYNEALTLALPLNNLPRRFQVTPPLAQADIETVISALNAIPATPIPPMPTAVDVCRRTLRRDATVWAGPGEDYEVLTELEAGTVITAVLATTDPLGATWWQLENSGWIALADVAERGNCIGETVPGVVRVSPPTNTYLMERCESFNGPVRARQQVTFEFIPPAWDNYGAARDAVLTDPGRFVFNEEAYRATASSPFPLGTNVDPLEDRYLRRFTFIWTAQPGTYRITGDWLTYEPSCNLTVPVE